MTKQKQIYQCGICGNITEVLHPAAGTLVCCGKPMNLLEENTKDAATEKHVPVVEKIEGGYLVSVGSIAHPMEEEHYIEWIELVTPTQTLRKFLQAGEEPKAVFYTTETDVFAREFCNLHGLWKNN